LVLFIDEALVVIGSSGSCDFASEWFD